MKGKNIELRTGGSNMIVADVRRLGDFHKNEIAETSMILRSSLTWLLASCEWRYNFSRLHTPGLCRLLLISVSSLIIFQFL